MNTINQIIRGALFLLLALFGMAVAFIFMASTAIAVAVLYVVARIQGRPFGIKAYWAQRQRSSAPTSNSHSNDQPGPFKGQDVTDIEMREIP
ncbi:hypothetical protein KVP09_07985 [Alcaligenaceae bacterium CGII-47]|nr:hypothetical protein [Alcaligenaceae bacterium CGII-47]